MTEPFWTAPLGLLFGLCIGSFLNVVIHRLPKMMERDWRQQCSELRGEAPLEEAVPYNLARPRSACPACGHAIGATENIPVLSYLMLGGRCSACRASIPIRYPMVEVITGLLSAYALSRFGLTLQGASALLLIWTLIALSGIDFDTQLLPDSLTLPLVWLGILTNLAGTGFAESLEASVVGAMAGYLALWSVFWLFKLATGKEGMGYGDFKLLAALGAWLGWQLLPAIVLLSSLVGAVVGIVLIGLAKHGRNVPIPFGPYLAAAGLIALFWGRELTQAYLGLIA